MASVQLEFFRAQKVSRAVDLQISTPRCASHGCNSLERALANQLAACKKMQKDTKIKEGQRELSLLCTIPLPWFACSYHIYPYLTLFYLALFCSIHFPKKSEL